MQEPNLITTEELMKLLRVSRQTLTNWKDQGMPPYARGKWDIRKVFEWYVDKTTIEKEATKQDFDLEAEKARKTKIEADLKQIELDLAQGKAVTIEEAITKTSQLLVKVKNIVMNLPQRVAPRIIGKSLKETKLILQDQQREALNEILNFKFYEEPKAIRKKKPVTKRKKKV
jgi:phage terminase Nu1 subunit (DNA packaging protein)